MTREFNLARWYRDLCAEGGGMKLNRNPRKGEAGMTREELKQMGIAAGISEHAFGLGTEQAWQQVERFAALVAVAEREACAKLCFEEAPSLDGQLCAEAIRARGQE